MAHLAECFVYAQERVRSQTELMDQSLANARRRFRDGVRQRLQQAGERQFLNLNGIVEGTRKHLGLNEERFHRRMEMVRGSVERTFDARLAHLAATAIKLQDKIRGSQDHEERDLCQRKDVLLAAFTRLIKGQLGILELKTSRFNLPQYERFMDQMLKNLGEKNKRLDALSPELLLARGYSLTRDEQGRILRNADEVQAGQIIYTQLAKGELASVVTKKEDTVDDRRRIEKDDV
jgi:exodeoxyribonuclease VII large subunit